MDIVIVIFKTQKQKKKIGCHLGFFSPKLALHGHTKIQWINYLTKRAFWRTAQWFAMMTFDKYAYISTWHIDLDFLGHTEFVWLTFFHIPFLNFVLKNLNIPLESSWKHSDVHSDLKLWESLCGSTRITHTLSGEYVVRVILEQYEDFIAASKGNMTILKRTDAHALFYFNKLSTKVILRKWIVLH